MKILINHKKIINSPFNDSINTEDEDTINQLEKQLLNGNNSSLLVSGYRGSGKTSLICKLEKRLNDNKDSKKIVFINLELTKYENHTMILRKIIREIYLTLSSNKSRYSMLAKNDPDLTTLIELLYDRTFSDVTYNSNIVNSIEHNLNIESMIDFKKIIALLVLISALGFNIKFNFIPFANIPLFVLSVLYAIFKTIQLKLNLSERTLKMEEISRKSLYDDEIAEYHVKNILSGLKEQEFRIIISLDEIDKIEDQDEIEMIISELKPIMLSDIASFIIVSGQKLYYKFINSNTIDDSLISTVFPKLIHVRLLSNNSLKNIFMSLVEDNEKLDTNLLNLYIDSLILNSNRIIRRFINIISQNILWSDNRAYLIINDDIDVYASDAKYLEIISNINENEINAKVNDAGFRDFFMIQLHIWIQKIKQKGFNEFRKEDIFNFTKDYPDDYLKWCSSYLDELFEILLKKMLDAELITRRAISVFDLKNLYYKRKQKNEIQPADEIQHIKRIREETLKNTEEIEKTIAIIFEKLYLCKSNDSSDLSILDKAGLLFQEMIISQNIYNDIKNIIETKKYLNMSTVVTESDAEIIKTRSRPDLKNELITGYIYHVCKDCLDANIFELTNIEDKTKSFIAVSRDDKNSNLLFRIVHYEDVSKNDDNRLQFIVDDLHNYNIKTNKCNKMIILFWESKDNMDIANLYFRIHRIIEKRNNIDTSDLLIIPVFCTEKANSKSEIEKHIRDLLK